MLLTFRYNLPYLGIVGGVSSIESSDFLRINGMSNLYEGWGAEDDDFFKYSLALIFKTF